MHVEVREHPRGIPCTFLWQHLSYFIVRSRGGAVDEVTVALHPSVPILQAEEVNFGPRSRFEDNNDEQNARVRQNDPPNCSRCGK